MATDPQTGRRIKGPVKPYGNGVSWHPRDKVWQAYITIEGKRKHLGYYDKEEDAKRAREKAEKDWVDQHSAV